jgi:septal ring factor EnvC (AmiA/AmiB activator)
MEVTHPMISEEEAEARLRADLDRDKKYLAYQRQEFDTREKTLLEREANIKQAAREYVESDKVNRQHDVNVRVAEKVKRYRIGDVRETPTAAELQAALDYFGADDGLFALCFAVKERDEAAVALVAIHRAETRASEATAERQAREAAIQRLVAEERSERESEYAAQRAQVERLER